LESHFLCEDLIFFPTGQRSATDKIFRGKDTGYCGFILPFFHAVPFELGVANIKNHSYEGTGGTDEELK